MKERPLSIEELELRAKETRRLIIEMLAEAGSGHPGGSLSATDLVVALYANILRFDPREPHWPDRDRFHMSKGHCCPLWYAVLAQEGFFPRERLKTLRKLGSNLQGHPAPSTPGVESASGSLGQGLSVGLGMSLAGRIDKKGYRVYVL
ncbi:MAG: transketolase, partial [Candidatus Omnitrophica bacterium]|nr:transketolase [Candidatus Omnitrophota bacterium]